MKKLCILLLSFICLSSLSAFADCGCGKRQAMPVKKSCEKPCQKPCQKKYENPCDKPCPQDCPLPCSTDKFLCTKTNLDNLAKCANLSNAQLCNAHKIQEKYEQEVLSLNERIQCEKQKLCQLEQTCSKFGTKYKQKRLIKRLEKDKKQICKCYEKQFKATLSNQQIKAYNKAKK